MALPGLLGIATDIENHEAEALLRLVKINPILHSCATSEILASELHSRRPAEGTLAFRRQPHIYLRLILY